ncbi:MAG: hypothetical protein LZF64_09050 [Nitrosomonas sp.]|nr:MAG: hypothetical protein LZF64_09050 [Nitrosomonas sp.]
MANNHCFRFQTTAAISILSAFQVISDHPVIRFQVVDNGFNRCAPSALLPLFVSLVMVATVLAINAFLPQSKPIHHLQLNALQFMGVHVRQVKPTRSMACDPFLPAALGFKQTGADIVAQRCAGDAISEGLPNEIHKQT